MNLSLENSPNSALEFGKFSKLDSTLEFEDFEKNMSLEILHLSLKNSPDSTLEFEDFEKNMSLEISHLSLENSPNSIFFKMKFLRIFQMHF